MNTIYEDMRPYNLTDNTCEEWFEENYFDALDKLQDKKLYITEENIDLECINQYDFHEWYNDIKDFTFQSEILKWDENKTYNEYKFMRTEKSSPKDILFSYGIENKFKDTEDFRPFLKSNRCKNSKYIIVRDFKELDEKREFRCFYFNGSVKAISQYNEIYVEEYQNEEKQLEIKNKIKNFIKNIDIPYNNAIIDVYLDKIPIIIELNCFGGHLPVGACLYDWKRDYNIIYSKRTIPDIRFYQKHLYDF